MKRFIYLKQVKTELIDGKERQTGIAEKGIEVNNVHGVDETEKRVNFDEIESSCQNRYYQWEEYNGCISKITLKEPDKESNSDTLLVIGNVKDLVDALNS